MGVFDRLVLFSEVHGTVLQGGRPVEGAELIQTVVWSDNEKKNPVQMTMTDRKGAFWLSAIERRAGLLRMIPAQPVMLQKIVIHYQGTEYMAWRHAKMSYDANTELDGRPLSLICELSREPSHEGKHYGICKA